MLRAAIESIIVHGVMAAAIFACAALTGKVNIYTPPVIQMSTSIIAHNPGNGEAPTTVTKDASAVEPRPEPAKPKPAKPKPQAVKQQTIEEAPAVVDLIRPEPVADTAFIADEADESPLDNITSADTGSVMLTSSVEGIGVGTGTGTGAPANEGIDGIFSLKELDVRPQPLHRTKPEYPRYAKERKIEGSVTISFVLNNKGSVNNPKVVKAIPQNIFENSALEAVRAWQFSPAKKNGEAVNTHMVVTLNFLLETY